jgi:hypothetical protein
LQNKTNEIALPLFIEVQVEVEVLERMLKRRVLASSNDAQFRWAAEKLGRRTRMRTVIHRTTRLLGGLALLAGIPLAMSAPARAQTITATPQNVIVAKHAARGATTITWDAGAGIKNVGATLWQQIDGGNETLVAAKAKGSQGILIGAGETRVFKLRNFIKSKVLASVTVTATETSVSFAGMWAAGLKIGGRMTTLTYKFEQTGNKVTGYILLDNDEKKKLDFEGVVSGNTLRFQVTPAIKDSGSGEFVMAQDGKSFTGNIGKMPVTAIFPAWFAGVWHAKLGEGALELILQQTGKQVTGQVKLNSADVGIIREGIVDGNTLRFNVVRVNATVLRGEPRYQVLGSGELVMDEGGKLFTGHVLGTATSGGNYNQGANPDDVDATWNGKRPAVSFTGCWKLTGGTMDDNTICLRQESHGRVTATMGDFEGTFSGNTLRFTHRPAGAHRSGRFLMNEGGKSFRGFWHAGDDTELNENPCTGILVPAPKK